MRTPSKIEITSTPKIIKQRTSRPYAESPLRYTDSVKGRERAAGRQLAAIRYLVTEPGVGYRLRDPES
jgi:hypothetical protein